MNTLKTIALVIALTFTGASFASEVNINTMDAASIAANLKGIGMKKAEAIVSYRETNGPFTSIDELANVRGIGTKTVAKIRDNVLISQEEKAN